LDVLAWRARTERQHHPKGRPVGRVERGVDGLDPVAREDERDEVGVRRRVQAAAGAQRRVLAHEDVELAERPACPPLLERRSGEDRERPEALERSGAPRTRRRVRIVASNVSTGRRRSASPRRGALGGKPHSNTMRWPT